MDCVCRGDEEEESRNCGKSPLSEYNQDSSDVESGSVSASRHEHFSCKSSAGSSPHDSPLRNNFSPLGRFVQHAKDLSPTKPDQSQVEEEDTLQEPLDFENNGRIWYPPPPEDENDDAESNYFAYDDDEDEDDIGETATEFSLSSSFASHAPKLGDNSNEPLRTVVHDHFRALVAELLRGEELTPCDDDGSAGDWLDIVTALAWQAATFVKPDTRAGGSMDPGSYVKIKCVASGNQNERYSYLLLLVSSLVLSSC